MSGKQEPAATSRGDAVKYGELIVLGYNGSLPDGDRGRRKSRFALHRRAKANGVQPSSSHITTAMQECKAVSSKEQHSISYGLSRSHVVVVEYVHDLDQDMFLVGRSGEAPVDFVVMDTAPWKPPGGGGGDGGSSTGSGGNPTAQSTISRFACRILCERSPPHRARVYAAGFDSSNNIFLGERATKWRDADGSMDGLTTNGVLVMHPRGGGELSELVQPGVWREVSVGGKVYTLRETRSAQHRGCLVETESNELQDGSLVDLCGATLLWRTAEGLRRSPTVRHIELLRQELNAARPQCPVGLNTLAFPSAAQQQQQQRSGGGGAGGGGGRYVARPDARQPWAYLTCGHVHGRHDWGLREEAAGGTGAAWQQQEQRRECPVCRSLGPYVALSLGCEAGFYVDGEAPTHALTPCGHVCSERTARYWAAVPLPHGTHAFHATCPFCAAQLTGEQGFVRLIFQGPVD